MSFLRSGFLTDEQNGDGKKNFETKSEIHQVQIHPQHIINPLITIITITIIIMGKKTVCILVIILAIITYFIDYNEFELLK